MKNHPQNISNKPKRGENNFQNKKRGSFSQNEGLNETKKKSNASPQKSNEIKKDIKQQISDTKDNNYKISNNNIIKLVNNFQSNNYINNIKDKQEKKKIENIQPLSKDDNIISLNSININDNKENNNSKKINKINAINIQINDNLKNEKKDIVENKFPSTSPSPSLQPNSPTPIVNDENFYSQLKDSDKKLKENLQA